MTRRFLWPGTVALARAQGTLTCGSSQMVSANTAPAGSDDWFRFSLATASPNITLSLTGQGAVYYDVIEGGSAPPAVPANSKLTGAHTIAPKGQQVTVRVWSPAFGTYSLTASAK